MPGAATETVGNIWGRSNAAGRDAAVAECHRNCERGHLVLRVHLTVILAVVVGLTSCGGSADRGSVRLAELVPVVAQGVSTDIILPPYEDSLSLLDDGWEKVTAAHAREEGLWIVGTTGSFRFYAAVDGPATLEAEATALSTSGAPQGVTIELNGQTVHSGLMNGGWSRYEYPLPASGMRIGWNTVTLRFDQALRPTDLGTSTSDARPLSARFRRLRVRSGLGRALWTDRPSAPVVTRMRGTRDDAFTISMPTDSALEFYLLPGDDTVLTGAVGAAPADDVDGEIWASIELLEESGNVYELLAFDHGATRGDQSFDISLGTWASRPVQLRLRCWGRSNGVVRWHDLTLSGDADPTVAAVTRPAHLVVPPRSGRLSRPDVIVIVLDAARADAFHQETPRTPHADALAAAGTRFERGWAPSPWTGQSIPVLLTGRYPGAIGAEKWGSQVPADVPMLAELVSHAGYFATVWSHHNIYRGNRSLRRGFERATNVRSNVLEDRNLLPQPQDLFVDDRPSFALIHLLPPHGPYRPPPPFEGRLSDWYSGDFATSASALNRAARGSESHPTWDDIRYTRARYDENVEFADHLVGRLLQMFREADRYDDAMIVLTSDHGEGFFEHGRFLHTRLLYEEFLRIPFIIKWPAALDGFMSTVDADVSLVDLVPTLVDGLGLNGDLEGFQGRTLLPLAFDGVPSTRSLFAQTRGVARGDATPRPSSALVAGRHKVILTESSGAVELFELSTDPTEQNDLGDTATFRAQLLLQHLRLQQYRSALALSQHVQQPDELPDAETIRNLRGLGYLR